MLLLTLTSGVSASSRSSGSSRKKNNQVGTNFLLLFILDSFFIFFLRRGWFKGLPGPPQGACHYIPSLLLEPRRAFPADQADRTTGHHHVAAVHALGEDPAAVDECLDSRTHWRRWRCCRAAAREPIRQEAARVFVSFRTKFQAAGPDLGLGISVARCANVLVVSCA